MKRILTIMIAILVVFAVVGCAGNKKPPAANGQPGAVSPDVKTYPPKILEHKGTVWGAAAPNWVMSALKGYKEVEKMPDYQGKFVIIVEEQGADLSGTELAASRLNAQTRIAALISTRVKDSFAGAQVGDKDKIESYMERVVKSVSEATFSGFFQEDSWWVHVQTYTSEGKADKQEYRVIQLWTIPKDALQKQLNNMLASEAAAEPKTPEKQRAMDQVQQSFYDGF
ncbi:MAG: hypothetical protein NT080_03095 [Spirochaetes bacterium]|nr:hypothetical protein [Spirochaetota bacterium]